MQRSIVGMDSRLTATDGAGHPRYGIERRGPRSLRDTLDFDGAPPPQTRSSFERARADDGINASFVLRSDGIGYPGSKSCELSAGRMPACIDHQAKVSSG